MFKTRLDRGRNAISGMRCAGHVRDSSGPQQGCSLISRHFYAVSGTPCAGHVLAAVGTQPDFQAFLGSFWVTVCKPCLGCGMDIS
ncbi:Hypothetical predicted protein [Olea europaea subsp. europaea]|uniref:Uncharacterized protein n=1 Tax=Olea europaea subsp. europaea TaxID=158383 RepID=A0A8S0UKC2_OLEEU|nr:Hypothetical predicted protein [Olea europaea subsp. europaea]